MSNDEIKWKELDETVNSSNDDGNILDLCILLCEEKNREEKEKKTKK